MPATARRHVPPRTTLLAAVALAIGTAMPLTAQSGTVTFAGVTNNNGAVPIASYSGPALTFSTVVRAGFGNTAAVSTADGRWWTGSYSGQGMVYGNNSGRGNVLEVTLDAGAGSVLSLTSALFGGYANAARNVTFQLFNADYSQSTALFTVLTGTTTPASPTFALNGWGSIIRLQFTETNASGAPAGRGAFDVGVQGIQYTVSASDPGVPGVVPEPSAWALMATGLLGLAMLARRRAAGTGLLRT